MKNIFGSVYDKDREEPHYDGERFVARKADYRFENELQSFAEEAVGVVSKAGLSPWLSIVKSVAGLLALLVAAGLAKGWGDVSFSQMFENAPFLFIGGGVCAVIWAVLFVTDKIKYRKIAGAGAIDELEEKVNQIILNSEQELNVPHEAPHVDILQFQYTEKNGKVKIKKEFSADYSNEEMRLFKEGDNLCLANLNAVYAFPIDSFRKFVLKKKKASMDDWSKEEPYNKGEYKQYKIKTNDYDDYFCRYYALQLGDVFGEYEIFFPEYELKHFQQILNLPVEEE